jgi:hypothetical protein
MKKSSPTQGTCKRLPANASTRKSRAAAPKASERKREAAAADPVGSYMRERRGILGKGYKLSY